MRVEVGEVTGIFHVCCPHTGCSDGTPASLRSAEASDAHWQQARSLWRLYHNAEAHAGQRTWRRLLLPALTRKETFRRLPQNPARGALPPRGKVEAKAAKLAARGRSFAARAARQCLAAGLPYSPPPGVDGVDPVPAGEASAQAEALRRRAEEVLRRQEARIASAQAASPSTAGEGLQRWASAGAPHRTLDLADAVETAASSDPRASGAVFGAAGILGAPLASAPSEGALSLDMSRASGASLSTTLGPGYGGAPLAKQAGLLPGQMAGQAGLQGGLGAAHQQLQHQAAPPPPVTSSLSSARPASEGGVLSPEIRAAFPPGYVPRGPSVASPPRSWILGMQDISPRLEGGMVQIHWPDDGKWWPTVVASVNVANKTGMLLYETGDEERADLWRLVQRGEIAWLFPPTPAQQPQQQQQQAMSQQQMQAGLASSAAAAAYGAQAALAQVQAQAKNGAFASGMKSPVPMMSWPEPSFQPGPLSSQQQQQQQYAAQQAQKQQQQQQQAMYSNPLAQQQMYAAHAAGQLGAYPPSLLQHGQHPSLPAQAGHPSLHGEPSLVGGEQGSLALQGSGAALPPLHPSSTPPLPQGHPHGAAQLLGQPYRAASPLSTTPRAASSTATGRTISLGAAFPPLGPRSISPSMSGRASAGYASPRQALVTGGGVLSPRGMPLGVQGTAPPHGLQQGMYNPAPGGYPAHGSFPAPHHVSQGPAGMGMAPPQQQQGPYGAPHPQQQSLPPGYGGGWPMQPPPQQSPSPAALQQHAHAQQYALSGLGPGQQAPGTHASTQQQWASYNAARAGMSVQGSLPAYFQQAQHGGGMDPQAQQAALQAQQAALQAQQQAQAAALSQQQAALGQQQAHGYPSPLQQILAAGDAAVGSQARLCFAGRWLDVTVAAVIPEQACVHVSMLGKAAVLKTSDEGVKWTLSLGGKPPGT